MPEVGISLLRIKDSYFYLRFTELITLLSVLYFFFNLSAAPRGMWDLSSLTRAPCSGSVDS